MFSLVRKPARHAGSNIAYAIALATGVAVGAVGISAPAYAQKQQKPKNSKGFITAYSPVLELSKAEAPDEAALRAGIETMVAAIENEDDRYAAGAFINNVGVTLQDTSVQQRGISLMIDSGKVPPEQLGKFYYTVGQLAYNNDDFGASREALMQAAAINYTDSDVIPIIADTYFQEDRYEEGVAYYKGAITERQAAGQTPPKEWLTRALATAYNNDLAIPAIEFAAMQARFYPSATAWRDAINIQRNLVLLEGPELLDLMRLADRAGTMEGNRDYLEYADAADVLRAPGEVKRILDKGIAAGAVNRSEPAISDALSAASSRIEGDKADLPELEAEALGASSTAALTLSAADAFLSYGSYDKAEALYQAALQKPGVNASAANMRLGIAQLELGKVEEAKVSFGKVTGQRKPIATLWTVYADQQANGTSASAMEAAADATEM
uniref:hypothetical protein n=1 Tax=Parerythrobacter lutipelagi TaxID=1964208 RepID=UPI0013754D62|nr:hypothetical protein [Parerythrobacter lutipelagi]